MGAKQLLEHIRERTHAGPDEDLVQILVRELREIAASFLRRERPDHTLQATALVNEAYVRLANTPVLASGDREHFLSLAARAMRHVLIDHARKRRAARRGGDHQRVSLSRNLAFTEGKSVDLLLLDELLDRYAQVDPRGSEVVEMRFFAGLSIEDIAGVLDVSDRTVKSDWATARAWFAREMDRGLRE